MDVCGVDKPEIDVFITGDFGQVVLGYPQCCEDFGGLYTLAYDADYTAGLIVGSCGWTYSEDCNGTDIQIKLSYEPAGGGGYNWVIIILHEGTITAGTFAVTTDCDSNDSTTITDSSPFISGCRVINGGGTLEVNP